MKPLAYRMRPTNFKDIVGQDHLVGIDGVITLMIEKAKPFSFILYGPPGTGKTSIAMLVSEKLNLDHYIFNASTDLKPKLKSILDTTNYHNVVLIVDEIHRMKTDIQDYLLPFLENGKVICIGLTTQNPYMAINPAIRSRLHIYEVKSLNDDDIIQVLRKSIFELDVEFTAEFDALKLIARLSNHEVRSALNILESSSLLLNDGDILTTAHINRMMGKKQQDLDASGDHYYELLSALQKSIRGSDVDASIHYLARLITLGDINSIIRRLLVIVYEDIGLANPNLAPRVLAACQSAQMVGLPEARIALANIVIDMAISPKSNTAYLAINQALADMENKDIGKIPDHVNNAILKVKPDLYHYPHDDKDSLNDQRHLPKELFDVQYFFPKDESPYERALKERLALIDKIKFVHRKK